MLKRTASTAIAGVMTLCLLSQHSAAASANPEKDERFAQKVKAAILKLSTGRSARVDLKLKDKTKLTGYLSEIGDTAFVVTDLHSAAARTVAYPDVAQVQGNNLSTGVKIAIGVGIAIAVIIVLYMIKGAFCDGC